MRGRTLLLIFVILSLPMPFQVADWLDRSEDPADAWRPHPGVTRADLAPLPRAAVHEAYAEEFERLQDVAFPHRSARSAEFGPQPYLLVGSFSRMHAFLEANESWSLGLAQGDIGYELAVRETDHRSHDADLIRQRAESAEAALDEVGVFLNATRAKMEPTARGALLPAESVYVRAVMSKVPAMWSMYDAGGEELGGAWRWAIEIENATHLIRGLIEHAASLPPEPEYRPASLEELRERAERLGPAPAWDRDAPYDEFALYTRFMWEQYWPRAVYCLDVGWAECAEFHLIVSEQSSRALADEPREVPWDAAARNATVDRAREMASTSTFHQFVYAYTFAQIPEGPEEEPRRLWAAADLIVSMLYAGSSE